MNAKDNLQKELQTKDALEVPRYEQTGYHGTNSAELWGNLPEQDDFLESMAAAAQGVVDYFGNKIIYINVMNNLSVDCDVMSTRTTPR